jgi:hypothetical protein
VAQQLQCFTGQDLSIPLLRQLGRPGILTLQAAGNPPVFAVLTGLSDQTATLQIGGAVHRVSLSSLGGVWQGAFSTYWRPPPGFGAPLRDGKSTALVSRLAGQLATLEGLPASSEAGRRTQNPHTCLSKRPGAQTRRLPRPLDLDADRPRPGQPRAQPERGRALKPAPCCQPDPHVLHS